MKQYFVGGREITEAEAKEIEAKNQEIRRCGTIEELLKSQPITYKEVWHEEDRGISGGDYEQL